MALRELLLPWDTQPQEAWPAAAGNTTRLVLSFNAACSGVNAVDGSQKSGTGAAGDLIQTVSSIGRAVTASSTRSQYYTGTNAGSEYTLVCLCGYYNSGLIQQLVASDSTAIAARALQFRIDSTSKPELIVFNTLGTAFSVTGATGVPVDGSPFVVAGRVRGTELTVWLNGVQIGSATLTGTVRTLTGKLIHIANDGRSNNSPCTSNLFGAAVFAGAMSDGELQQINRPETYWSSVYAPRRIWVPVSAGAPSLPTLSALTTKPGTLTSTGFTVRVTAS